MSVYNLIVYDTFVDQIPADSEKNHWQGDECWCNPSRMNYNWFDDIYADQPEYEYDNDDIVEIPSLNFVHKNIIDIELKKEE